MRICRFYQPDVCSADPSSRLVMDKEYRNLILAELSELQAFLRQCRTEADSSSLTSLSTLSEELPGCSKAKLESWDKAVQESSQSMMSETFLRLLGLYTSPKYFQRMVTALELQAGQEAKHYRSVEGQ